MFTPKNIKVATAQSSQSTTVPAPVGGLNGRDPLAAMQANEAYQLDNIFPGTASADSRKGCIKYSTASLGAPVQSLEIYAGPTGDKMLAWAGGKIFDVSTPVPSQLLAGQTSNLVNTTMFSNAADNAQHLIIVSGYDQPLHYTTATGLTTLTFTGMTGSQNTLNQVFSFKGRLYFGQRDKLGFYYLPPGQIQGALSYFDLAQQSSLGGYLVAIASSSDTDTGTTPNDYIVFITSKGELITYTGFDPSNAANWALAGRYYSAAPIGGANCTLNYGTELVILTLEGALSFSEIRHNGSKSTGTVSGSESDAITSKLGSYLSQYNTNVDVPGWQGLRYGGFAGTGSWLLINVPGTPSISGEYYHFVMNTVTGAWCRMKNWNGMCFTVYNRRLYFGRYDGYIMLADEGRMDDGQPILVDCKQAYNYFENGDGLGLLQKHFQWASLLISSDGAPALSGKFNVDFTEEQPDYVNSVASPGGAVWDVDAWDLGAWGFDGRTQRFVVTLNKAGFAGSLWLRGSLNGLQLNWFATQYVYEKTKGLLI